MSASYTRLYVHLVWTTCDRRSVLDARRARRVHGLLARVCNDLDCVAVAVGGVEDHVHLLVGLHPSVAVADLVRTLKVVTSPFVSRTLRVDDFSWQEGYGAFSLRNVELEVVRRYILGQPDHHAAGTTVAEWEATVSPATPERG